MNLSWNMVVGWFRALCCLIDGLVYWLISIVYNLMTDLANTQFFDSTGGISLFTQNVYVILGVIMLFKVAFSLLTYIVNPDQLTDSKTGAGSLVKNIVICIGLILIVPIVFDEAMDLQRIIIKNDVVGRIITGQTRSNSSEDAASVGTNFSIHILTGFIKPNVVTYPACENTPLDPSCYEQISTYSTGVTDGDIFSITNVNTIQKRDKDDNFVLDYYMVISTIVGVVIVLLLINFCFDIAIRSVKLIFLRIIAPLPIASYVDPSGQKGIFSKWVKTCTSTYIDLFVRLAGIYFAFFIIQNVVLGGKLVTTDATTPQWIINIVMILGCLMFAKQLPKLVEDLTGIKMGGDFSLNPMKRMAGIPLAGGLLTAGGAIGGAGLLAGGRLLTGGGKALAQKMTGNSAGAKATWAATRSRMGARMKSGFSSGLSNAKNIGGNGKYETSGKGYSSMMKGKDAGANALGKQLYSQFSNQVSKSKSAAKKDNSPANYAGRYRGLIRNDQMRETAEKLDRAKDRRNALQSQYEQMKLDHESNPSSYSSEQIDKARVDYTKASSDYDKASSLFAMEKNAHKSDAERYDAFMKESDYVDAMNNSQADFSNNPPISHVTSESGPKSDLDQPDYNDVYLNGTQGNSSNGSKPF